jgi:carbonic anhydrase
MAAAVPMETSVIDDSALHLLEEDITMAGELSTAAPKAASGDGKKTIFDKPPPPPPPPPGHVACAFNKLVTNRGACGCQGYDVTATGLETFSTKHEKAQPGVETNQELHLTFDDTAMPGADTSSHARPTMHQKIAIVDGAVQTRVGLSSRAIRMVSRDSQLKVPTPISVSKGIYSIMAWVKLPLTDGSWHTLASGFTGDHQVIVDPAGRLGVSSMAIETNSTTPTAGSAAYASRDPPPKPKTQQLSEARDRSHYDEVQANIEQDLSVINAEELLEIEMQRLENQTHSAPNMSASSSSGQKKAVDCREKWGKWSKCSQSCGVGIQMRIKKLLSKPMNGGKPCGPARERRKCNTQVCACEPKTCMPPKFSKYHRCMFLPPGHEVPKQVSTPREKKWCHNQIRFQKAALRAQKKYKYGNTQPPCDQNCQSRKKEVRRLEHGKGENELMAKSADFSRIKISLIKKLRAKAKKAKKTATFAIKNMQGSQKKTVPAKVSLIKANATNATDTTPKKRPKTAPSPPPFTASSFNVKSLPEGWHHLAAVADGSKTLFYIDGAEAGEVAVVSKRDIYSIGNWQGGGHQWGDIDDFQLHSTALNKEAIRGHIGDQIPLVATKQAVLTASSTGSGCSLDGGNLFSASPWCAEKNGTQWLQASTKKPAIIVAVTVAGGRQYQTGDIPVAVKRTKYVGSYRLQYSLDGKEWSDYFGSSGQKVFTAGPAAYKSVLDPPIKASHIRIIPEKMTGGISMRVEVHGVVSVNNAASVESISVESAVGGRTATATCPPGFGVLSGGCNALNSPNIIQFAGPDSKYAWKCTGRGSGMKAMAMCAPLTSIAGTKIVTHMGPNPSFEAVIPYTAGKKKYTQASDRGGEAHVYCPGGYRLVGGGCSVLEKPFNTQFNFPRTNSSWACGGPGGRKSGMAMCSPSSILGWTSNITKVVKIGKKHWVSAKCPKDTVIVSGGCYALDGTKEFQYNGPDYTTSEDGRTKWTCGGLGSKKAVYALCARGTAKCAMPPPASGQRGKVLQNPVSRTCTCPKRCKCPTRNKIGYDTTAGIKRAKQIFASYGFCATPKFSDNRQKTPSCICPPRTPTNIKLEFKMTWPQNVNAFKKSLRASMEQSMRTPGKFCGCPKQGNSCTCRVAIDHITRTNATSTNGVKWQWRGHQDRWQRGVVDTVVVKARIKPVEERLIQRTDYHQGMSAQRMSKRFTQAITNLMSPLRRRWFFMRIANVAISDRVLKGCQAKVNEWSYRDAPVKRLTKVERKTEKIDFGLAERLKKQGLTGEAKTMRKIILKLHAAASGKVPHSEVEASVSQGALLASQLRRASRPRESAAVTLLVKKLSQMSASKKLSQETNTGPAMWAKLKKDWWRCAKSETQSPVDLGSQPQVETLFWDTTNNTNNSVTYSNSMADQLRFHYGRVGAQLENKGMYLRVNFTKEEELPSFTELGTNKKAHWLDGRLVGGAATLQYAHIHAPSEHTIKGKRYPMEIQLYHNNSAGGTVAVSVLLQFGFENPLLKSLFSKSIPLRCSVSPKLQARPQDVLPLSLDYFAYEGSQTKPPCKTGVSWYVLKNPSSLSLLQYVNFAKTLGTRQKYLERCNRYGCTKAPVINGIDFPFSRTLQGNARPIQRLGDRVVRASSIVTREVTSVEDFE